MCLLTRELLIRTIHMGWLYIVMTELRKTPKLLECDAASLMGSIGQVAQLGLEVGGLLGHAYLIPYGRECQLVIGYKGLMELARRSGQIKSIEARAVFEGDDCPADKTKDAAKLRQMFAEAKSKADYAKGLMGPGLSTELHETIERHRSEEHTSELQSH